MSGDQTTSSIMECILYQDALHQLETAGNVGHIDPNILERLKYPKRAVQISIHPRRLLVL